MLQSWRYVTFLVPPHDAERLTPSLPHTYLRSSDDIYSPPVDLPSWSLDAFDSLSYFLHMFHQRISDFSTHKMITLEIHVFATSFLIIFVHITLRMIVLNIRLSFSRTSNIRFWSLSFQWRPNMPWIQVWCRSYFIMYHIYLKIRRIVFLRLTRTLYRLKRCASLA